MNNYYDVLSLNLAAYLRMKGFEIQRVKKTDKGVVFYFERTNELFDAVTEYNNNVELKKFISEFKHIKQIVKAMK